MLFGGEEEVVADGGPLLLFWGEASGEEMVYRDLKKTITYKINKLSNSYL